AGRCLVLPTPLPSFPTRRSSDLEMPRAGGGGSACEIDGVRHIDALINFLLGQLRRRRAVSARRQMHDGVDAFNGVRPVGELAGRSEEHTSELQSRENLVCRLLLE